MMKRIAILGSTGSIGKNALRVIDALGPNYQVEALSAHTNARLLAEQARAYGPKIVALTDTNQAEQLKDQLDGLDIEILIGPDSLTDIVQRDTIDTVLTAIVGAAGLPSVLAAARQGKQLAIANKEPLVMAGELLTDTARIYGASILPVDSEHSAIFQALQAGKPEHVQRIILTGSGGPFRTATAKDLQNVTLKQALNHPVWNMGPKITIDSATMMNKALEIIEAHWLFRIPVSQIEVLIHPESIIHSLVEFIDGSVIAQMGHPDMCLPIQYALTYPERLKGIAKHLRLEELGQLTFESPNLNNFRALYLAYEVVKTGGTTPAVFNGANEAAVTAFMNGLIGFTQIIELVEDCLNAHDNKQVSSLEELMLADHWARQYVAHRIQQDNNVARTSKT